MRAGAGLPVLSTIDEYLRARATGRAHDGMEAEVLGELLDELTTWLDQTHSRLLERLSLADPGPLRATLEAYTEDLVEGHLSDLDEVRMFAGTGDTQTAWTHLAHAFTQLQTFRERVHEITQAARHLRAVANLVEDIPQDEAGLAALDQLASQEALAATEPTPEAWAQAACAMEAHCLDHIRLARAEPPATQTVAASGQALEVTWDPAPNGNGNGNGSGNTMSPGEAAIGVHNAESVAHPVPEQQPTTPPPSEPAKVDRDQLRARRPAATNGL
ncbi:MAG: hypothetical protein R3185_02450, partial [Candidatus Thermoplasmatota archaeon]|nr:hypothetical protein [Candidatus Thermoplasmatota archaeon]